MVAAPALVSFNGFHTSFGFAHYKREISDEFFNESEAIRELWKQGVISAVDTFDQVKTLFEKNGRSEWVEKYRRSLPQKVQEEIERTKREVDDGWAVLVKPPVPRPWLYDDDWVNE